MVFKVVNNLFLKVSMTSKNGFLTEEFIITENTSLYYFCKNNTTLHSTPRCWIHITQAHPVLVDTTLSLQCASKTTIWFYWGLNGGGVRKTSKKRNPKRVSEVFSHKWLFQLEWFNNKITEFNEITFAHPISPPREPPIAMVDFPKPSSMTKVTIEFIWPHTGCGNGKTIMTYMFILNHDLMHFSCVLQYIHTNNLNTNI